MEEDSNHYTAFGSALPSLSEDEPIRKKPLRIEEQVATDENGRRRFHGAFTGGFSAGFYNTAGSRDGWAPTSPEAKKRHEPQMTSWTMTIEEALDSLHRASSNKRPSRAVKGIIPLHLRPVFGQIFLPVKDSIGGIGPKLRRAKKKIIRKANARVQVRGDLKGHPSDSEEEEDEAFQSKYKDFLFSPDDVPLSLASPKVNSYLHLFPPPPTTSAVKFKTKSGARGSIKGQALEWVPMRKKMQISTEVKTCPNTTFPLTMRALRKTILVSAQRRPVGDKTSFVLSRMVYKAPQLPKNFKPMVKRANPRPSDRQAILALTDKKEESLSKEKIDEIEQILQSNKSSVASTSKEFQKRYDDYLLCSKSNCGSLGLRLIHSKESEALEFMRTKSLFKPLVSSMAAKFVSANQSEGARDKGPSSHLEHAVKSKSYGQLTREKVIWHPAPLLCVRFNVKNPYLGKDDGLFSHILETEEGLKSTSLVDSTHSKTLDASKELHSIKSVTEDELPKEKPPIDLFKSIFLDSSDSEEDEEENVDADDVPSKEPPITEEKTQQRVGSSKIPTGVFAGIDLDSLVCKSKPPSLPPKPIPNTTTTSVCTIQSLKELRRVVLWPCSTSDRPIKFIQCVSVHEISVTGAKKTKAQTQEVKEVQKEEKKVVKEQKEDSDETSSD
ncbi:G patch domaincontaining protein 1 -like protein [Caligus rogercresseyi]|uniref:G patch domaincontaining protein 1 -like protein n=1 Tax=Caligus rogercresseyi TaxID=217165 RepID=A0A7T8GUC4_CALRO|nr:G patch domaincontaining protein 1 -like protein [Caligus rogercresseyi]